MALALIITYGGVREFRASVLFILVGHVLYTLPFMLRSVMAVLAAVDVRTLEEGAASLGASPWQRFIQVVVPNARPGILAGSLMVVTLSIGEFNLTWMLHTPLTPDPAGGAGGQLRLHASRNRQCLHAGFLHHDRAAADRHPDAGWCAQGPSPEVPPVTAIPPKPRTGAAITLTRLRQNLRDGTRALEPVDLAIAAGETVVLLGPSGCGKTTTLRIIAGLEAPDAGGIVRFDAEDVTAKPIEKRNVGMVFQSYALFPNMTVVENVAYGLRVRGVPKAERLARAGEVLEMMRIDALAHRGIDQLSGGQRQRVALARALAVRPRAILLDEPLTALDAALREHLRAEIDALLRRLAITAIYVTHDQAEALALGDRIVVMRQGAIAQIGTPREIYFHPANDFVASFVGITNRIEGAVRDGRFDSAAGYVSVTAADQANATLAFRPEAARLCDLKDSALHFKVEQVHFQGARQRILLSARDGARITVEAPPELQIVAGDIVGVAVDPSRLALV